jgi:hypothetical protein
MARKIARLREPLSGQMARREAIWLGVVVACCIGAYWNLRPAVRDDYGVAVLERGEIFPAIKVRDLEDRHTLLFRSPLERPLILYVFDPYCSWCKANQQNIEVLTRCVLGRYDLVALSLSRPGIESFYGEMPSYPVLVDHDRLSSVYGTPTTVLIGRDQRIERIWSGALRGEALADANQILGCDLPGVG